MSEALNLYRVVFEETTNFAGVYAPPEWGQPADVVVARNHSQARYLAWQQHPYCASGVRDVEKCSIKRTIRGVDGPPRIATMESWTETSEAWGEEGE